MEQLKQAIKKEQPAINAAVERYLSELPAHSRPIARHIFQAGGKRLRPLMALWSGRLFGCTSEKLHIIGASLEMLHAATLLHDDIMDNANLRRGRPAAHTLFSRTHVILAGDAMLAKSLCLVSGMGDPLLTLRLSEAALQTAEGQIAESANIRNASLPYEEYMSIITGKTAWLLMTACEMGAIYAGASKEQVKAIAAYGLEVGIAFQLVDDALDFAPSSETGKPCGGDLAEGKMTPPLLYYLHSLGESERKRFAARFTQGDFSPEELAAVAATIYSGGFSQKTRDMAAGHVEKALAALSGLPDAPERQLLENAARYIIARSH